MSTIKLGETEWLTPDAIYRRGCLDRCFKVLLAAETHFGRSIRSKEDVVEVFNDLRLATFVDDAHAEWQAYLASRRGEA